MNCRTFKRLLPEYLYGELLHGEQAPFETHSAVCPDCGRMLAEMQEAVSLIREEMKTHFSGGEMAALRLRVKEEVERQGDVFVRSPVRGKLRLILPIRLVAPVGAVAAAVIVVAVLLIPRPVESPRYRLSVSIAESGTLSEINDLVAMSETVEEEFQEMEDVFGEINDLQMLFADEPNAGSEVSIKRDGPPTPA